MSESVKPTPGSWIAYSADRSRIIAVAQTFAEVCEQADATGEPDPIIARVPEDEDWSCVAEDLRRVIG